MVSARYFPLQRKPRKRLVLVSLVLLGLGVAGLASAASIAATDAASPPPDFPAYLAQHQADLQPFFTDNGSIIVKNGLHILVSTAGNILLATAVFGWLLDVPLAWGFSTVFAPAYARFPRALIYACGRLVLALMLTVVLSFAALVGVNAGAGLPALLVVAVLTVPAVAVQVFWVGFLYRTSARPSLLFYVALLSVHALIFVILVPTLFSARVGSAVTQYMNDSLVPTLRAEADKEKRYADTLAAKRDAEQSRATEFNARIAQDKTDEQDLRTQIEARRHAPAVLFSQLVLLRAQGDLAQAGTGLADFISKYPQDGHTDAARGQLAAVNEALSAQLALRRQQDLQQAQSAAAARRQLLADANAGQATLSEMRRALLGKSTAQVAALFGAPSETAADKWGYGKRMVYDPESRARHGLAIVFSQGIVQGVDYYYGDAQ